MIIVSILALLVYLRTMAPTITWRHYGADGGDLIAAVATQGVPHPTGYPTYTLLGQLFLLLPWGDPAYRLNLMSAVFAALAVGLLYLILLSTFRLFRHQRLELRDRLVAAAAALAFALSPLFWSQALITEVYTLNAFFIALVVYLALRWMEEPRPRTLAAAALACGLGAGNHVTILFLVPALAFLLVPRRRHLPASAGRVFLTALPFLIGLGVYAYLPLAAAHHPPVNWGDPSSWRGFLWTVSGRLYRDYFLGLPLRHLPARFAAWAGLLVRQFGWWGFLLGLVGCWSLWERARGLALFSSALFLGYSAYAVAYDTADSQVNLIPALFFFALWLGWGLVYVLAEIRRMTSPASRWSRALTLALVLLIPLLSLVIHAPDMDVSADTEARDYGLAVLDALQPRAILVAETDRHTFTLWYMRYAERRRPDVAVFDANLLNLAWYRANAAHVHPGVDLSATVIQALGADPALSPYLVSLVEGNWDSRPVYFTDPSPSVQQRYQLAEEGLVHRVLGPAEP